MKATSVHRAPEHPRTEAHAPRRNAAARPAFSDLLRQRRTGGRERASGACAGAAGAASDEAVEFEEGASALAEHDGRDGEEDGSHEESEQQARDEGGDGDAKAPEPQADTPTLADAGSASPGAPAGRAGAIGRVGATRAVPAVIGRIVQTVCGFCNDGAVVAGDGWQVRLPLRADVLPATVLHLRLSSQWLCLRFEIADDEARAVVLDHRDALARRLEDELVPRREVAIDID